MHTFSLLSRRHTFRVLGGVAAGLWVPGAFAEALTRTPDQTEGPFYPDHLPLDTDNDLLMINDQTTPALGEVTYLSGRILNREGEPLRDATVEIWQCDNNGAYIHSRDSQKEKRDKHFQGYGRFLTGEKGEYLFRTIKPVPYPGRTPHIHAKVRHHGKELLTTQLYIKGHSQNDADGVRRGIRDLKQLESVTVDFKKIEGGEVDLFTARWDIVVGLTPDEKEQ